MRATATAALLALIMPMAPAAAQVINGYGTVRPMKEAQEPPSPELRYRIVFDITKAAEQPAKVNPGLDRVARFVNLLAREGIRPTRGDLVAIIHGPATPSTLNADAYRKRNGAPNPNTDLIRQLTAAGVSIRVCSQALAGHRIAAADVDEGVQIDVAGVTTLANLQLRGYSLIPD
jgi:intracellular sulfur oxidation DsrE/DsrF family protein